MSLLSTIPPSLRGLESREAFMDFLVSMPISFHDRLHLYFTWIDLNEASYTSDDIFRLKVDAMYE